MAVQQQIPEGLGEALGYLLGSYFGYQSGVPGAPFVGSKIGEALGGIATHLPLLNAPLPGSPIGTLAGTLISPPSSPAIRTLTSARADCCGPNTFTLR